MKRWSPTLTSPLLNRSARVEVLIEGDVSFDVILSGTTKQRLFLLVFVLASL